MGCWSGAKGGRREHYAGQGLKAALALRPREPHVENGRDVRIRPISTWRTVRPHVRDRKSSISPPPLSPKWKTRIDESHLLQGGEKKTVGVDLP